MHVVKTADKTKLLFEQENISFLLI